MSNQIAKLRHQLEVAQTLARAHVTFVVVPVFSDKDELELAQLAAERLEALAALSEVAERQKETMLHVPKRQTES